MDILEALVTRRSIRKFTSEPVSEENLRTILRSGCYAPSANNKRPWHFIVVHNKDSMMVISNAFPGSKVVAEANCCIVVCGDKGKEDKECFLLEDCANAMENMLLAIHGLGLGAVWCGMQPIPAETVEISKLLNLPGNLQPIGVIALGHKAEERISEERFDPQKIHYDKW